VDRTSTDSERQKRNLKQFIPAVDPWTHL